MSHSDEGRPSSLRLLVLAPLVSNPEVNDDKRETNTVFTAFLSGLTGSKPSKDLQTFAGYTSHPPLRIRNKYYASDISLWCDELPGTEKPSDHDGPNLRRWTESMLSEEAKEVRQIIGGLILLLPHYTSTTSTPELERAKLDEQITYIQAVTELRDAVEADSGRDLASLVALQSMVPHALTLNESEGKDPSSIDAFAQKLEDSCISDHGIFGWDVVHWQPEFEHFSSESHGSTSLTKNTQVPLPKPAVNEYGEKLGMPRILEVLEHTNWDAAVSLNGDGDEYGLLSMDDFFDTGDDFEAADLVPKFKPLSSKAKDGIAVQSEEFQQEIIGLHFALEEQSQQQTTEANESGDDEQVEQLAGLMNRVVAIRAAGSEMPKEERERFARREVGKLMRDMKLD